MVAAAAVTGHRTRTGGCGLAAAAAGSHIDLAIVVREVVGGRKGLAVAAALVLAVVASKMLGQDIAAVEGTSTGVVVVAVAAGQGLYCVLH